MEPGQNKDVQQNEVLSKVNLEMLAKNINFVLKIRAKDLAEVKLLLNETDVNFVNSFHDHNTPLHYAVATGEPELVGLLLNHGAKFDAKNLKKKWTRLSWLVSCRNHRRIRLGRLSRIIFGRIGLEREKAKN